MAVAEDGDIHVVGVTYGDGGGGRWRRLRCCEDGGDGDVIGCRQIWVTEAAMTALELMMVLAVTVAELMMKMVVTVPLTVTLMLTESVMVA